MIFEAVAAIELANKAIKEIKELASHVTSVGQMGKQLTQLADAHDQLEKDAQNGDMEAFWALEPGKNKEYEIKQMFIYAGRAGLWDDYQKFIKNRKEMRRRQLAREEAAKKARKKAIVNGLLYTGCVLVCGLAISLGIWLLLAIIEMGGK